MQGRSVSIGFQSPAFQSSGDQGVSVCFREKLKGEEFLFDPTDLLIYILKHNYFALKAGLVPQNH